MTISQTSKNVRGGCSVEGREHIRGVQAMGITTNGDVGKGGAGAAEGPNKPYWLTLNVDIGLAEVEEPRRSKRVRHPKLKHLLRSSQHY